MEIWKDIEGFQGKYQVSNLGNVKSLNFHREKKEVLLKHHILTVKMKHRLYKKHRVTLLKNSKHYDFLVSKLVYETFNGKIPDGMQIDHINNNPEDNRLDNLQILTPSENTKKIYEDNKLFWPGRPKRKIKCLNDGIVYDSIKEASQALNLYKQNINKVLKGKYKHTGGYKFEYVC